MGELDGRRQVERVKVSVRVGVSVSATEGLALCVCVVGVRVGAARPLNSLGSRSGC